MAESRVRAIASNDCFESVRPYRFISVKSGRYAINGFNSASLPFFALSLLASFSLNHNMLICSRQCRTVSPGHTGSGTACTLIRRVFARLRRKA